MADNTISAIDCRSLVEHAVLEQKPFMFIELKEKGASYYLHVGDDDIPSEKRSDNNRRLQLAVLDFTERIDINLMKRWSIRKFIQQIEGDNSEEKPN